MDDPLFDELLADAEAVLGETELSVAEATDRVLGNDTLDLEVEREVRLRSALIAELDRRHATRPRDPEEVARLEEEWADRGDLPDEDVLPG